MTNNPSTSGGAVTRKKSATKKGQPKAAGRSGQGSAASGDDASRKIDKRIKELGDWRGKTLQEVRRLILEADPNIVEEWKWAKPSHPGTPVWSHHGILCTGETYTNIVKLTFAKGASMEDPAGLFNASREGKVRRAIDIHEGESLDPKAFRALIQAAIRLNLRSPAAEKKSSPKRAAQASPASAPAPAGAKRKGKQVVLLSGGNPQIAKADGDAPVQAYIAAMPGWKSELGKRLDALIVQNAPGVRKAVRWNSPFYGVDGRGWFLSFHVFTRYVKVTFFSGAFLTPVPPGGTPRSKDARWIDLYSVEELDEPQMAAWIQQAAALPGWIP